LEEKALHALIETGFLTPPILAYNRWMLSHLPENAIILTNGDMDTYPAVALQEVQNYRPDVAIVNYSLLNTNWYARFVRDVYKIQLPVSGTGLDSLRPYMSEDGKLITAAHQIMKGWLRMRKSGKLERPVAIAVTVGDLSFAANTEDHLRLAGPYRLWLPEPIENAVDTTMMRMALAGISPDDYLGPFVSPQDRSSVRMAYTNRIVTNITELALHYSKLLLESGRAAEAYQILGWAEEFENRTELGSVYSEQINALKEAAQEEAE
jgi:hypothetical protein